MIDPWESLPQNLEARISRYFAANPDEELSIEDVCDKFGCSRQLAVKSLGRMSGGGTLLRVSVYRLKPPAGGIRVAEAAR